ncbi:MAG: xylose isomerase, partial [Blastocatellia bacterium]
LRRESIDPKDIFYSHIGGMDVCARALLVAEQMITDGRLAEAVKTRYAGWREPLGQKILAGDVSLEDLAQRVVDRNSDVQPKSGRQEYLENLVNLFSS